MPKRDKRRGQEVFAYRGKDKGNMNGKGAFEGSLSKDGPGRQSVGREDV